MKAILNDVIPIVRRIVVGETQIPDLWVRKLALHRLRRANVNLQPGPYPDASKDDYQTIHDWLRNPPLMPVRTGSKRSFQIAASERQKCTKIFDATITDFYKKDGKVEFLPRVRQVERVIYQRARDQMTNAKKVQRSIDHSHGHQTEETEPGGPKQIMEDALEQVKRLKKSMQSVSGVTEEVEYTKNNLCFRWIHLPANNVSFPRTLTVPD